MLDIPWLAVVFGGNVSKKHASFFSLIDCLSVKNGRISVRNYTNGWTDVVCALPYKFSCPYHVFMGFVNLWVMWHISGPDVTIEIVPPQ